MVLLKAFQKLAGRLQHIFYIMPGGWDLFSLIHRAMQGDLSTITIMEILRETIRDWCTIIKQVSLIPTHVLQLVDGLPEFLGYCDSCHIGVGGVLMGVTKNISFIVWRL